MSLFDDVVGLGREYLSLQIGADAAKRQDVISEQRARAEADLARAQRLAAERDFLVAQDELTGSRFGNALRNSLSLQNVALVIGIGAGVATMVNIFQQDK